MVFVWPGFISHPVGTAVSRVRIQALELKPKHIPLQETTMGKARYPSFRWTANSSGMKDLLFPCPGPNSNSSWTSLGFESTMRCPSTLEISRQNTGRLSIKWGAEWLYRKKQVWGGREKCLIHRRVPRGYGGTSHAVGMASFCLNVDPTNDLFSVCLSRPAYLLKFSTD